MRRKYTHTGILSKTPIKLDHRYCKGQKRKSGAGKGLAVFLAFLLSLSPAGCSPSPTPESSVLVTTMAEKTTSAAEEKTTAAEQGSSTTETSITTTTAIETTTERTTEESSSYIYKESSTEEETTAETEESTEEPTEISTESNEKETTQESTEEETPPPTTTERPTEAPTQKPTEPPTQAPTTAQPTQAPTKPEPTTPEPTTEAPTKPQVVLTGIEASVTNKTRYIGESLTAGDFTVKGIYSDGTKKDISGWSAAPLKLNAESNNVTVTYQGVSTVVTVAATVKPTEPPKEAKLVDLEIIENGNQRVVGWRVHNKNTPYGLGYDVYAVYSDNSKRKVDALYYPLVNGKIDLDHPVDGYKVESSNIDVYRVGGNDITLSYNGVTKTKRLSTVGKDPTKTGFTALGSVQYSGNYSAANINAPDGVAITVEWSWLDSNGRIIEDASNGSTTDGIVYKDGPFYVDVGAITTINIQYEGETIPVALEADSGFSRALATRNFNWLNEMRKSKGLPELIWWENGYFYTCLRALQAAEDLATYGWSAEVGHSRAYVNGREAYAGYTDISRLMQSELHAQILTGNYKGLCSISCNSHGNMIVTIVYVDDSIPFDASIYIDKDFNLCYKNGTIFRTHRPEYTGTADPRWIDYINTR